MDFLKKNWARIIIATASIAGAILMLLPVFMSSEIEFFGACQNIGLILFFVGTCAGVCLKMCDTTKPYAKYVLLATGILVLTFMSIGLAGFNANKDKAEGALGNAYAIFKSVSSDIDAGQEKITGLTTMASGFGQAATAMGAAALTTPLSAFKLSNESSAALVAGFVASGLGTETMTVAQAATVTATAKAIAESQLPSNIDATKQDANAAASTVLFGYISMMIALGLIPAIRGTKKLVCKSEE